MPSPVPRAIRTELGRARRWLQQRRLPSGSDNVAYNRDFWNRYAKDWRNPVWRALGVGPARAESSGDCAALLGEEWGSDEDVDAVLERFLFPYLTKETVAAELGSGGGRIATRVAPRVKELHCLDISSQMLAMARDALADQVNVQFVLLGGDGLPDHLAGRVEFLYSFDVWVHLDLHTMWTYLEALSRFLRPGGRAFLHTANLAAPEGWNRFASQDGFSVEGHYFVTPDVVKTMLGHTTLRIIDESAPAPAPGNHYLNRDYLFVVERPR